MRKFSARMALVALFLIFTLGTMQCTTPSPKDPKPGSQSPAQTIDAAQIARTIEALKAKHGASLSSRIARGVGQVASLWRPSDGTPEEFDTFCQAEFVGDSAALRQLFDKLSNGLELLYGYSNLLSKELLRPTQLVGGPVSAIDGLFGAYSPSAHIAEDLYANRIALITALNFPCYTLQEKNALGPQWSRQEWAYARMGDMFTSRVPAELLQRYSQANTDAATYISEYNIQLDKLTDSAGMRYFPEELSLLSHWGLRDEIKSQYAQGAEGLARQRMIYRVMQRIVDQSIPREVINRGEYAWDPAANRIERDGQRGEGTPEGQMRYQHLLNQFRALRAIDAYHPQMPTFVQRLFEGDLEIPVEEVEALFTQLLASQEIRALGQLISQRLGRPLEPFDIWYDGFKSRSGIAPERLEALTRKYYPDAAALQRGLPSILRTLGWSPERAEFIADRVRVEAARGSGHAWGAEMRKDNALLRTRIPEGGMDYKGFNIGMHEFGHNVEQTISLHNVDHYMLHGVPNTAFTEALAFVFQKRDLAMLGLKETNPLKRHLETLDNLWGCYEIMGVSLVDINLWRWMYAHPEATAEQVKGAALQIAQEIWNQYYADLFGSRDETILAIYSHMIENPLYLSAYPIGHLIDFQLETHFVGRDFAGEVTRIFSLGRLTPREWLRQGVGEALSVRPILTAAVEAMEAVKAAGE